MFKRLLAGITLTVLLGATFVGCAGAEANKTTDSTKEQAEASNEDSKEENLKEPEELDFHVVVEDIPTADISSNFSVHDPSIVEDNGTYYIFGSHMTAAKCTDLKSWEKVADNYNKNNPTYGQIYDVADEAFAYSGNKTSLIPTDDRKTHVWAPDVIYNKTTGLYNMYYCTTSTWNASNLCFGTSENIEGPYEWQSALIYSGFNMDTISGTDVLDYVDEEYAKKHYTRNKEYNFNDYPNAIDPTIFYDKDDRLWMTYGSWSGGIFILELDPETGLVIHPEADEENGVDPYFGKKLLGGGHKSIEGPYILYDAETDYYYLYVSYGVLTSNGGYQIRVFRSKEPDGTYEDMNGKYPTEKVDHAFFGLKLSGNYKLPSLERAYMATGHNSAFVDTDGKKYIAYHTRFNDGAENHSPRVHQYFTNKDGWPCMLPYQTQGETISATGYDMEKVAGRYFYINQGTSIDSEIANPEILYLLDDGTVKGKEVNGKWSVTDGTYYVDITIEDKEYSGIFCEMKDEAGTDVMTFSAVGSNESIWGVKY